MIKTIFPTKTATLYQATASLNTGQDEIMDIIKIVSGSGGDLMVSRPVIQFDTAAISASLSAQGIHTGSDSGSLKYFLKAFISKEEDVAAEYKLVVHPLRQSWTAGTGRLENLPQTTDGCSWSYRTGLAANETWGAQGGFFGTTAVVSHVQSFSNVTSDIELDITGLVENWHDGTLANYGIIVKRSGSEETNINEFGKLSFYSKHTNTIYPPRLEVRYDDSSHAFTTITGSEVTINDDIKIQPRIRPEYVRGTAERIFVDTVKQFSVRTQANGVGQYSRAYLPQSSSFAIIDNATGEKIINHDATYTYIGRTDNTLNYFDLDTTCLFPERYYEVQFKVNYYSGTNVIATRLYNCEKYFKVVR